MTYRTGSHLSPDLDTATVLDALKAIGHGPAELHILTGPKGRFLEHLAIRREVAKYLLSIGYTYSSIGRFYNQDHATIMSLINPRPRGHHVPK